MSAALFFFFFVDDDDVRGNKRLGEGCRVKICVQLFMGVGVGVCVVCLFFWFV